MKLKVTLSQLPMSPPIRGELTLPITNINPIYTLTYNLTKNCSTTNKFIDLFKQTVQSGTYSCSYNFYPTIDGDGFIAMKNRMNWIIERIKTMDEIPNVGESLVLDVNSLDTEKPKLNALHLYFEDVSNDVEVSSSVAYGNHEEVYIYLEEINQLVHSIEGWFGPEYLEFFGSIRVMPGKFGTQDTLKLPLTDEDYSNFTIYHKWGDLTLDYFRVGKDLMASYSTQDFELIKNKGLCQQNTVHTCFEMRFKEWGKSGEPYYPIELLNKWCVDNNVRDYYDIDLPMFASGRVVLGKIDMTGTTQEEVSKELSKCSGITTVELIDE
jgi:hypothetical protein